jgi:hypothetical protein
MVKLSYELFGFILIVVSAVSLFIGVIIDKPPRPNPKKTIDDLEYKLKCYQADVRRLQSVIKDLRSRTELTAETDCPRRSQRH